MSLFLLTPGLRGISYFFLVAPFPFFRERKFMTFWRTSWFLTFYVSIFPPFSSAFLQSLWFFFCCYIPCCMRFQSGKEFLSSDRISTWLVIWNRKLAANGLESRSHSQAPLWIAEFNIRHFSDNAFFETLLTLYDQKNHKMHN